MILPPKIIRYALVGGVTFIWGAILYNVITSLKATPPPPAKPVAEMNKVITLEKEDFYLFANYPDPFIPEEDMDTLLNKPVNNPAPAPPPPPVEVKPDLSFIEYHGLIANNDNKTKIALVSLHRRDFFIKEKGQREDILFRKIYPDKLEIIYKKKKYTIVKN